jgi:Zn-dependent protease with chaperone function
LPIAIIVINLFSAATRKRDLPGRALRPADEPELTLLVRQVAERLDFRAPLLVRVVPTPDAALLSGKVSGVQAFTLILGWPLLRYFSAARLAAVVAHELSHKRHISRRASFLLSARESVAESLDNRIRLPTVAIQRVLRVTQRRSWDLEFAADSDSARVAGTAAVRDALDQTGPLQAAFDLFSAAWIGAMEEDGAYPEDLYDALEVALRDPHVAPRVAALAAEQDMLDPYGVASHPPVGQRLAALPDHAGPDWDETRPVSLRGSDTIEQWCLKELVDSDGNRNGLHPARVLAIAPERLDAPAAEARHELIKATRRNSAPGAIAGALDAIGDGTWPSLARAIAPEIRSAPAELRAAAARDVLEGCLGRAISATLLDAGWDRASRWMTSIVIAPDGTVVDVHELLETALDSGETGPVLAVLKQALVPGVAA